MTLVDHVAQAIRIHDGDHTKGAAALAEIACTAVSQYFEAKADNAMLTERVIYLAVSDWTRPDV